MALADFLNKPFESGVSPLIDAARAPKETPQFLAKIPAAPKFGEDDVGTMEGMLSAGRSRLANLQIQEAGLSTRQANLTTDLANLTSQKLAYDRQKEEFGAKQRVEESRANYDNIKKIFDDEINSPQYKEKQRINKEIAEYQVFAPTEVTAPMLGVLFAAIGATGMLLGGNSKNNAKAALSAMNGMAEGFGEGRRQYDKERKAAFDTNVKLLQTKLSAIKDGLEDARREAVLNKQAADQKVRETLAVNEAQFLQENTNKRGLESTIALVDGQLKNINQATNLLSSKISQLTGQLDSKETQILMRKIDAASRESEKRIATEQRQRELEQRQKKLTPVGMQGDNIVMSDELGNITLVPTGEGFVPKAGIQPRPEPRTPAPRVGIQDGQMVQLPDPRTLPTANVTAPISSVTAGAKKEGTVKPPPKEILFQVNSRDTLIPALKELLPTLDRLNREGKYNELAVALNSPTGAEWYFRDDIEAIKAIRILAKFRSGEFETAGKALTKKEDEILRPLYQAANRPYVAVKNAVEEGLKELTQQNKNYKNAYADFYSRQSVPETPLAQRMDQAGATPGGSTADIRSKAQEKILEINKRTDINESQKQELVGKIGSLYKQKTGMDL